MYYWFHSIINSVICGAPKPGAICAFSFSLQDVCNCGALKTMLLNTSRCNRLKPWKGSWLQQGVHHADSLQNSIFDDTAIW